MLQEVFLRIHRHLPSLREDTLIAAWVYQITRNTIVDHLRAKRVSTPLPEIATETEELNTDNALVGKWLQAMINDLPETYREAVRLAEIDNLPQAQIAERLHLSVSGAKSRVQRGRESLKQMLDRCCHVEFDRRGNVVEYRSKSGCC